MKRKTIYSDWQLIFVSSDRMAKDYLAAISAGAEIPHGTDWGEALEYAGNRRAFLRSALTSLAILLSVLFYGLEASLVAIGDMLLAYSGQIE